MAYDFSGTINAKTHAANVKLNAELKKVLEHQQAKGVAVKQA